MQADEKGWIYRHGPVERSRARAWSTLIIRYCIFRYDMTPTDARLCSRRVLVKHESLDLRTRLVDFLPQSCSTKITHYVLGV